MKSYNDFENTEELEIYNVRLLSKGYKRYVDWWLPIDVAGGSFLAPMSFEWWLERMLTFPDEKWFDRWILKDELILGKDQTEDSFQPKYRIKHFIVQVITHNALGNIKEIQEDGTILWSDEIFAAWKKKYEDKE